MSWLKVAIVGCGKIADGHVEEIQKMPEVARVVATVDLELLMAEQLATRYGLPAFYSDVGEMLAKEKPDVVHITTPPGSHLALARQAMDAGCHVYCEKPLALDHEDAKKIVEHAEKTRKKLSIGYTYLFDPPAIEMRELVKKGELGTPVHVETFFGYGLSGQFGAAILGDPNHWVHKLPGKLFHNNIDHLLNKITEFIEDDEPKIIAQAFKLRPQSFGDVRDQMMDELRVMIRGERTTAYATFSSHIKPTAHFCRVYGTKNTIHADYSLRSVTLEPHTTLPSAVGRLVPAFDQGLQYLKEGGKNVAKFAKNDFHYFSGLSRLFEMYYASIREDAPLPISHRDMLRVSWMMDEIFRQTRVGS